MSMDGFSSRVFPEVGYHTEYKLLCSHCIWKDKINEAILNRR